MYCYCLISHLILLVPFSCYWFYLPVCLFYCFLKNEFCYTDYFLIKTALLLLEGLQFCLIGFAAAADLNNHYQFFPAGTFSFKSFSSTWGVSENVPWVNLPFHWGHFLPWLHLLLPPNLLVRIILHQFLFSHHHTLPSLLVLFNRHDTF